MNRNVTKGSKAFTLIELLAVIAVVAILSAIVVSAVGSARQASLRVETTSNLRQVYSAVVLYAQDRGGRLPSAYEEASDLYGRTFSNWREAIAQAGYLGSADIPSAVETNNSWASNGFSVLGSPIQRENFSPGYTLPTFGMNGMLGHAFGDNVAMQKRLQSLLKPSRTLFMAEGSTLGADHFNAALWPDASSRPDYLLDGMASAVYGDGHVGLLSPDDFPVNSGDPHSDEWYFWIGAEM
jgi:prepilin-type N-terminal cleavage/methylation domain-containing protein